MLTMDGPGANENEGRGRLERLLAKLRSPLDKEREAALVELARYDEPRIIRLMEVMSSKDPSLSIRHTARKLLHHMKRRLQRQLSIEGAGGGKTRGAADEESIRRRILEALRNGDSKEKAAALRLLAHHHVPGVHPLLLELLAECGGTPLESLVIETLGSTGAVGAFDAVTARLEMDSSSCEVKCAALKALEMLDVPEGTPYMVRALFDKDRRVRKAADAILRRMGKLNVGNTLKRMLMSDEKWQRRYGARAMALIVKEEGIPLLKLALSSRDRFVREKAREGLERLAEAGSTEARELLEASTERREAARDDPSPPPEEGGVLTLPTPLTTEEKLAFIQEAADAMDSAYIPKLLELAGEDEDDFVRATALITVGRIGNKGICPELVPFLSDPVARVRANAVEATAMLAEGDQALLLPLIPKLQDPNNRVKANAIIALKQHPHVDITAPLRELATSGELNYRKSALYAVSDLGTEEAIAVLELMLDEKDEQLRSSLIEYLEMKAPESRTAAELLERMRRNARKDARKREAPGAGSSQVDGAGGSGGGGNAGAALSSEDLQGMTRFFVLPKQDKMALIRKIKEVPTLKSYLFLKEASKDEDFEIRCLAKMALKHFDETEFDAAEEEEEPFWMIRPATVEKVQYEGMKNTIQMARELNERAVAASHKKFWEGPFDDAFPLLNSLREDTQQMLLQILCDEQLESVHICFMNERLRQFGKGDKSLDSNLVRNLVQIPRSKKEQHPFLGELLDSCRKPAYLLALMTDKHVILFLREHLDTSSASYLKIPYKAIEDVRLEEEGKSTASVVLKCALQYHKLPELAYEEARSIQERTVDRCARFWRKAMDSGLFDPEEERRKLDMLLETGVISRKEYDARMARLKHLADLSGAAPPPAEDRAGRPA